MDNGNGVVFQTTRIAVVAKPRPPTLGGLSEDGMTARILPDHDGLRVLIADDDADTTDSLALLLRIMGHEVWAAYSAGEAIAMAFRFQPDVLLLDVSMPDLDGFSLVRVIRHQAFLDDILLVAVTGYADDAHRQKGIRAGFDHYLAKPVEPSVFKTLLLNASVRKATRTACLAETEQRTREARGLAHCTSR
jgi:CheY-like chemotaxis protein